MEQEIKDRIGNTLGIIKGDSNRRYAYDRNGIYLGYYDEQTNATYDERGMVFSLGDSLIGLLFGSRR